VFKTFLSLFAPVGWLGTVPAVGTCTVAGAERQLADLRLGSMSDVAMLRQLGELDDDGAFVVCWVVAQHSSITGERLLFED
jgi:hypothetical protein